MLNNRFYILIGAVNGWLENSSPEQYSCNLMSTRRKTMRLCAQPAKTRSMLNRVTQISKRGRGSVKWCIVQTATVKGDEDILRVTGAVNNDLVAAEARYHKACHATYISKNNLHYEGRQETSYDVAFQKTA